MVSESTVLVGLRGDITQQVHTVDTDTGHHHQPKVPHYQAAVLDRVRHGEYPRPNVAL